jgi:hypothetical protein
MPIGHGAAEEIRYPLDLRRSIGHNRDDRNWPVEYRNRAAAFLFAAVRVAQRSGQEAIGDAADLPRGAITDLQG